MANSQVTVHTTSSGRKYVRTPDSCFENLLNFDYPPNYVEVDGLRVHYIDEGPADGQVVLMLHGQPDWSYLYRKMIPPVVAAGHRVVAPDMIGMGRSDKPTNIHTHTVEQHVDWLWELITKLDLKDITLFCQDWGGPIGLTCAAEHPEAFARILAANGFMARMETTPLDVPQGLNREDYPIDYESDIKTFQDFLGTVRHTIGEDMSEFFCAWMRFALTSSGFKPSQNLIVDAGVTLNDEEIRAYDAPFPDEIYRTGVRTLPSMAALIDEDRAAKAWCAMKSFQKPFLTVFGEFDLLTGSRKIQDQLTQNIPGAAGQPHGRIPAGHFIQESAGEEMGRRLNSFIANS
jgi:pimeloyl-ACP methyl ester carboxylesterase